MAEISNAGDPSIAAHSQRFFKTGPGEYGEGDVFAGVRVPVVRRICRAYRDLSLAEIAQVLSSPVHEHRFAALAILDERARKAARRADRPAQRELCEFYLAHRDRVDNWDLVDVSCRDIAGEYLRVTRGEDAIRRLARSRRLWDRRIAMISTSAWIRAGELEFPFELAESLLDDDHDLMHKAVGWMLRECGKRDPAALARFLDKQAGRMPRTALRYAIEHLPQDERKRRLAASRR
jgi:3-methyladenine DNA glycosylase AlkD